MPTLEQLDKDCPKHDRDSCSDERPINAGIDYRYGKLWCRRCEGLWQVKAEAALAATAEVKYSAKPVVPWTRAEIGRLWRNSPGVGTDVKSEAAFVRIARLFESAKGITQ